MMGIETRVGYKSISVVNEIIKDYITKNTINNKYVGDVHYLRLYSQYKSYLQSSSKTEKVTK